MALPDAHRALLLHWHLHFHSGLPGRPYGGLASTFSLEDTIYLDNIHSFCDSNNLARWRRLRYMVRSSFSLGFRAARATYCMYSIQYTVFHLRDKHTMIIEMYGDVSGRLCASFPCVLCSRGEN